MKKGMKPKYQTTTRCKVFGFEYPYKNGHCDKCDSDVKCLEKDE